VGNSSEGIGSAPIIDVRTYVALTLSSFRVKVVRIGNE
jgi:hypothetical protein